MAASQRLYRDVATTVARYRKRFPELWESEAFELFVKALAADFKDDNIHFKTDKFLQWADPSWHVAQRPEL